MLDVSVPERGQGRRQATLGRGSKEAGDAGPEGGHRGTETLTAAQGMNLAQSFWEPLLLWPQRILLPRMNPKTHSPLSSSLNAAHMHPSIKYEHTNK